MGRSRKRQEHQNISASEEGQPEKWSEETETEQAGTKSKSWERKSRKQKPGRQKPGRQRPDKAKTDKAKPDKAKPGQQKADQLTSEKSNSRKTKSASSDRRMRRLIGLLILPAAVILLIAAAFFLGNLWRDSRSVIAFTTNPDLIKQASPSSITPDTKEYIMDFEGSILQKDAVPEIQSLMEQYFLSITDCDMDTFLHLFTSQDTSEEAKYRAMFEKQREYIEGYQNITCYTVKGMDDHSYVVYVSYDVKFVGVDTLGPDLVHVYAVKGNDGQYRIYDEPITAELEAYLDQVSKNEDVRLLISQVDHQAEEAMSEDEELKKRIMYLKNGPPYMQEEKEESAGEGQAAGEN